MAWDIDDEPFTQEQWWKMCDKQMCRPEQLHEADLNLPWVYYRPWGLMVVQSGYHQGAMALLYAFHLGFPCVFDAAEALGINLYRSTETLADRFLLELEGTAFKSSIGSQIVVGKPENLDARERQAFRKFEIQYL